MSLTCSVVITTRDRYHVLASALAALSSQVLARDRFEVILVDDGSTSPDLEVSRYLDERIRCAHILRSHCGPAQSRNVGVEAAQGEIIVFLDDDARPTPNCLLEHIHFHEQRNAVAWGLTTVEPDPTDITTFPNPFGFPRVQRNVSRLVDNQELHWDCFMGCNCSIRKSDFTSLGGFNSAFTFANYEDLELGYRLFLSGRRILVSAKAHAFHSHYRNFHERARWAVQNGMSRFDMWRMHPELFNRLLVDNHYYPESRIYLLDCQMLDRGHEIEDFRSIQEAESELASGASAASYSAYVAAATRQFLYYESVGAILSSRGCHDVARTTPWQLPLLARQ